MADHGDALEYDLMTRAHATLDDVPKRIPWRALRSFVAGLDVTSRLFAELHPKQAGWTPERFMLADIFDAVMMGAWSIRAALGGKTRRPKAYPRPQQTKSLGRGAIPVSEFDKWWNGGDADG